MLHCPSSPPPSRRSNATKFRLSFTLSRAIRGWLCILFLEPGSEASSAARLRLDLPFDNWGVLAAALNVKGFCCSFYFIFFLSFRSLYPFFSTGFDLRRIFIM